MFMDHTELGMAEVTKLQQRFVESLYKQSLARQMRLKFGVMATN
jgi:tetrahydromethanopterin S-methyltransferase subunit F